MDSSLCDEVNLDKPTILASILFLWVAVMSLFNALLDKVGVVSFCFQLRLGYWDTNCRSHTWYFESVGTRRSCTLCPADVKASNVYDKISLNQTFRNVHTLSLYGGKVVRGTILYNLKTKHLYTTVVCLLNKKSFVSLFPISCQSDEYWTNELKFTQILVRLEYILLDVQKVNHLW